MILVPRIIVATHAAALCVILVPVSVFTWEKGDIFGCALTGLVALGCLLRFVQFCTAKDAGKEGSR